jgi:hypothetical protein
MWKVTTERSIIHLIDLQQPLHFAVGRLLPFLGFDFTNLLQPAS